ncbi:MAG TPA: ATP-binding protein [Kofleriaceae bacterium]|nr:ATP-binding protein [Kofleriaceae bacterium]
MLAVAAALAVLGALELLLAAVVGAAAPFVVLVLAAAGAAWIAGRLYAEQARSKAAAVEARATAEELRAILGGVGEGITVQDVRGRVVYANEPAARLMSFEHADDFVRAAPDDVAGRYQILTEDGAPFPRDELPGRIVLGGGPSTERLIRFRLRGADRDRYSMVKANPVYGPDGAVAGVVNTFRDVTAQREHDEALRVSREWFSTALRSIGDAVITTDRGGVITFMNPVAEQLTGWSVAEATGRPLADVFAIVDEARGEPAENPVERVMRDGVVVGLANHTILKSRQRGDVPIDDSAAPIRDGAGALVGVILVFRDVSAERLEDRRRDFLARAAEELNSSLDYEATLATVARLAVPTIADWCAVDIADDGRPRRLAVAHVDPSKIDFVHDIQRRYPPDPDAATGVLRILETGEPEMIAEIPPALIEAGARDAEHLALIRQLALHSYIGVPIRRGERTIGVITFVTAESRRVYGAADLALARSLADRAAVAVDNARLYREAQRARADAAHQRDRLEALIMAAPSAIAVIGARDLAFEMINEPFRRLVPHAEPGVHAGDVAASAGNVAMIEGVIATGQPWTQHELPVPRARTEAGAPGYVSLAAQPLRDGAGAIDRVVVFAHDVTDQVVARQRVEAAGAEAERANRSKDEFLAMLGHELRNPLAPILTALQLMTLRGGDAHQHERMIIERQVRHVVRLVDDLLDVSRITRGKVKLERERLELAEVLADAIEVASPLLEHGRHVLELHVPRQGLVVFVDRSRLAQVIANLLTNAAKYTESGGRIDVTAQRTGGQIELRVRDTGIGISADMLPRVFDLFVQQPQAIDRSRGGLGLGLTIVKNLVSLHDGEVSAHSDGPGKGSEFVVRLPAAREGATATSSSNPELRPPEAARPRSKVLIVDDNEDAADLLSMVLESRGYVTRIARDGPSALRVVEEFRPETALLDIGLPVMDGFELARRMRANPALAGLRLIAVTGYGQETDRQRSREAGFDHHLVKPIDVKTVVDLLQLP